MSVEVVSGTMKIGWTINERDLGILGIDRDLTVKELSDLYDRIQEIVCSVLSQTVDIWIDGEDKPPVRVFLEPTPMGDEDIEIDEGPDVGTLADLRAALS